MRFPKLGVIVGAIVGIIVGGIWGLTAASGAALNAFFSCECNSLPTMIVLGGTIGGVLVGGIFGGLFGGLVGRAVLLLFGVVASYQTKGRLAATALAIVLIAVAAGVATWSWPEGPPEAPRIVASIKLLPGDGAIDDQFGRSVAVGGDTAVVGAFSSSRSAYVFYTSSTP